MPGLRLARAANWLAWPRRTACHTDPTMIFITSSTSRASSTGKSPGPKLRRLGLATSLRLAFGARQARSALPVPPIRRSPSSVFPTSIALEALGHLPVGGHRRDQARRTASRPPWLASWMLNCEKHPEFARRLWRRLLRVPLDSLKQRQRSSVAVSPLHIFVDPFSQRLWTSCGRRRRRCWSAWRYRCR